MIEEAKVEPVVEKAPEVEVQEPEKVVAEEKVVEKAAVPPPAPVVEAKGELNCCLHSKCSCKKSIPSLIFTHNFFCGIILSS